MKRALAATWLSLALLAGVAGPVLAHEEFSPATIPIGRPVFVLLAAANERQVPVVAASLSVPEGLELGTATSESAGWTVERGGDSITWSGGPLAPGKFEQWGFEIGAPGQPGTFTFKSTLRFADGRTDAHDVVLTVTAAGTAAPAPAPAPDPESDSEPVTPTTVAVATTPPAAETDDDDASGRANLALGVSAGGLILGVAAFVRTRRPQPTEVAKTPRGEQEW